MFVPRADGGGFSFLFFFTPSLLIFPCKLSSSFLVSALVSFPDYFLLSSIGASSASSIYFMKSRWRVVVTFPLFCVFHPPLSLCAEGRSGRSSSEPPQQPRISSLFIRCICRSKPSFSRSQNCSLHRIPAISQRENHFGLLVPFCQVPSGALVLFLSAVNFNVIASLVVRIAAILI